MLSGIKLISRDQLDRENADELRDVEKDGRRSSSKKDKSWRKNKGGEYNSSDSEGSVKIRKGSSKKKWYSPDEYLASSSEEDGSDARLGEGGKRRQSHNPKGKRRGHGGGKKSKRSKREYSSEDESSSRSESEDDRKGRRKQTSKGKEKSRKDDDLDVSDGVTDNIDVVRKEMGLDWMTRPAERAGKSAQPAYEEPVETGREETLKVNPRELNPYLKDNGNGYPEDADQPKASSDQLLSSSLVGDGGASWRMKALKRAQEQATREGKNIKEVVQERWGSLGHLAVSVASHCAAAPRAHLHAIKSRKMGADGEAKSDSNNQSRRATEKDSGREKMRDISVRRPEMKAPKVHDSLSWGRRKYQKMRSEDAALISNALSGLNTFSNDGSFMSEFMSQQKKTECNSQVASSSKSDASREAEIDSSSMKSSEEKQHLSANQLAAKAMQLRLKGKHEEAEKLLRESENNKVDHGAGERLVKLRNDASSSRYAVQEKQLQQKGKEDDGDRNLAQTIMKNKKYSMSSSADDEYDFDGAPKTKNKRKDTMENRSPSVQNVAKRIVTQQERCQFCFENPKRLKHLVVAIANFTYLMLPQFQPVAPGHCCILTLQHELATRMVDDNVWDEIRNFKKCLIMMAAKQDKEVIFLETVLWLAQQRRHCLIECIPLPKDIAKEAPLYFKKAIDEAEDEWSQHDAKKLIDTSQKGLRGSIPKNFPYFHVEFGLNKGFVHVIDDESQFKSSFGLNVIRGMLQSQDENMYRRRQYESVEVQKEAVAAFAKDWESFDWTKQLD